MFKLSFVTIPSAINSCLIIIHALSAPVGELKRQEILESCLLAYYFCRYDDIDTLSPVRFLRSMVKQLLHSKKIDFSSVYDEVSLGMRSGYWLE